MRQEDTSATKPYHTYTQTSHTQQHITQHTTQNTPYKNTLTSASNGSVHSEKMWSVPAQLKHRRFECSVPLADDGGGSEGDSNGVAETVVVSVAAVAAAAVVAAATAAATAAADTGSTGASKSWSYTGRSMSVAVTPQWSSQ